jgi:hypothetical protein
MSVPSHQLGTILLQMFADDEVVRSILALGQVLSRRFEG